MATKIPLALGPGARQNHPMPNIVSIIKSEIARVARKEARAETQGIKKAVTLYRAQIAALKRSIHALEVQVKRLGKAAGNAATAEPAEPAAANIRFSAKSLSTQRKRLGLTASECGLLLNSSGQSVYKWEEGRARPRAKYLQNIAALRSMTKKDAVALLATLSY